MVSCSMMASPQFTCTVFSVGEQLLFMCQTLTHSACDHNFFIFSPCTVLFERVVSVECFDRWKINTINQIIKAEIT